MSPFAVINWNVAVAGDWRAASSLGVQRNSLPLSLRDGEDTKEKMEAEGSAGVEEVGEKCHLGGFLASAVRVKSSLMRQIISFECAGSVITQNNQFEWRSDDVESGIFLKSSSFQILLSLNFCQEERGLKWLRRLSLSVCVYVCVDEVLISAWCCLSHQQCEKKSQI